MITDREAKAIHRAASRLVAMDQARRFKRRRLIMQLILFTGYAVLIAFLLTGMIHYARA